MTQLIHIADIENWIGHEFVSDWVVVDQPLINDFARVTDDHAWVHVDIPRATALRGGTIAHGLLILTLFPGLMGSLYEIVGTAHGLN
jgi:Acyl dehydratase